MKIKSFIYCTFFSVFTLLWSPKTLAQRVPLGQDELVNHLDQELSGESAERNLEFISRLHRMRGSEEYNQAIDFITNKLTAYKLEAIETIQIPADGKIMYGTQKSRPAWNAHFAELWEMKLQNDNWTKSVKIADYESIPLVVAQDSQSGEVAADLVDIGSGTSDADYSNKNIKGKLVLTSSQPEAIVPLAIAKYGAAGIISYAQNQVTAWWKEDENLIRWGHLDGFSKTKTFAFMVSLKQARSFQERMEKGEPIRLHAKVEAEQSAGFYNILTAVIEGADPKLKNEEIVFSCHLDHPRPGANDNASGSATILEIARALKKLIDKNKIERPRRTIRFVWSPEIEGTTALLNFKPALAAKIKFNIHLDMVGGGPETKAVFHVSKSPKSVPSFINDISEAFGDFVNQSSIAFASGEEVPFPIVSQEGGKEALHAVLGEFHMGSDFQVYSEGSFRIPSIYLHDWPDRYIHTNYDVAGNIDPTKLKRAAFIGAGSGYYLANMDNRDLLPLVDLMKQQLLVRASTMLKDLSGLAMAEQGNNKYYFWVYETEIFNSLKPFFTISPEIFVDYTQYLNNLKKTIGKGTKLLIPNPKATVIYTRNNQIKGPMTVFGYDYFTDHYDIKKKKPAIFNFSSSRESGSTYAYETLNLVNGKNGVLEIRNILSSEFGPIPLELVVEYLEALASIGVINQMK